MKILRLISSTNPKIGGPIEGITQTEHALSKLGHSSEVVCMDRVGDPWISAAPMKIHALGFDAMPSYRYCRALVPWLRRNAAQYDGVIVHGLWQYHSLATRLALKPLAIPYIVYPHGMLDPWFKVTYPLKHLKKSIYWQWAEYAVLRDAAAVCFTSEEERTLARESFLRYKANEVVVNYGTSIPSGDPAAQRELFLTQFPELRGKRLLLFLSRIHVKKGCDILVKAFAAEASRCKDVHLVLAGPDQTGWQKTVAELAASLGMADRTTWTGMLEGDLKWGAFHSAEAFVLPSHQENFGIAVAEALACGIPVLISNKVNIWREIEHDSAGFVGEDTVEGFSAVLRSWLECPQATRQQMGNNARSCFLQRFEITNAASALLDVLSALREPGQSG